MKTLTRREFGDIYELGRLARLTHPHVVELLDYGELASPMPRWRSPHSPGKYTPIRSV